MLQRKILFLSFAFCSLVQSMAAQDDSVSVKPIPEKINVMDYKLQSWPKIEKLDSTKFSDHMFLSVGVGAEGFSDRQIVNRPKHLGFSGSIYLGKWFTAISGARLGASYSTARSNYVNDESQVIMGLTADYLLDFTSLIPMKYHYDRIFNFSLYAGAGAYHTSVDTLSTTGNKETLSKIVPGLRTGINASFRINQATSFFVESGVSLFSNKMSLASGNPDGVNSWRGFDISPTVKIGLTYRVMPIQYRKGVADFISTGFGDNIFITYAAGVEALVPGGNYEDNELTSQLGPKAQFGIGKWFSASSGARLTFNAGYVDWMTDQNVSDYYDKKIKPKYDVTVKENGKDIVKNTLVNKEKTTSYLASKAKNLTHFGMQADYLLNMNALFGGYRPSSSTGLIVIAGVNVNKSENSDFTYENNPGFAVDKEGEPIIVAENTSLTGNGWSFGLGVGFQAYARVTEKTNLFIEPRVNVNSKNFAGGFSSDSWDIAPSVMVGLTHNARMGIERRTGVFDNAAYQGWEIAIGGGVGTPFTTSIDKSNLSSTTKPYFTANIGKWFTGYSGIRLDGRLGFMGSSNDERIRRTKFASLGLYYQFNLTNAMMGYDFNRLEVIPSLGPELIYNTSTHFTSESGNTIVNDAGLSYGFSGGVKLAYNITRQFGLYVEPRVALYEEKAIYGSAPVGPFVPVVSASAGLVYKPYIRERRAGAMDEREAGDNLYFTIGAGGGMIVTNQYKLMGLTDMLRPVVKGGIGKWFSPISGIKLEATAAMVAEAQKYSKMVDKVNTVVTNQASSKMLGLGLYYNMNITNLLMGYDNHNISEIVLSAGPEIYYTSAAGGLPGESKGFIPGFSVGAQGIVNFNKSLGAYLEPRVGLYSKELNNGAMSKLKFDPMAQLTAGLIWRMGDYDVSRQKALFEKDERSTLYVEYAAGVGSIISPRFSQLDPGVSGQISLGIPAGPLSAFRFTGRGQFLPNIYFYTVAANRRRYPTLHQQHVKSGEIEIDYVLNIANMASGVGPKWYDFNMFLGGIAGLTMQNGYRNGVVGVRTGVQAAVNFSPSLAFFVEPSGAIYSKKFDGLEDGRPIDITAQVAAGFKYRFTKAVTSESKSADVDQRSYVQIGVGPGVYGRALGGVSGFERIALNTELMAGRWFNHVSGYRFGITNANVAYLPQKSGSHFNLMIFGLELDYMANLTNLFAGINKNRIVDLNGYIGIGGNYGHHKVYNGRTKEKETSKNFGVSGSAGMQTLFKVSNRVGLYVEPGITIHQDDIDADNNNNIKIDAAAKLTVGTIVRF